MHTRQTVWLVGMMGAGKSAVGEALAADLGRHFADSDREVEVRAGRSVRAIFDRDGEQAFRALERETIAALAPTGAVVALGGGAIAQPGMADSLAASGLVVYLRARPETLAARVGDAADRPLLAGLDSAGRAHRLGELLAERAAAYESAAITVDTDDRTLAEVVAAVRRAVETAQARPAACPGGGA